MASTLQVRRRRIGWGLLVVGAGLVGWLSAPGWPVWWAPRASAEMKLEGQRLFEHDWKRNDPLAGGDGLGPVFNATSCVACHFQGGVGGGGPNPNNVTAYEVSPTKRDPNVRGGLIHHFAVDRSLRENLDIVRKKHSTETMHIEVVNNCRVQVQRVEFDPVRTESINSTSLFGCGWMDRISVRAITHNRMQKGWEATIKEFGLDFSSVPVGRPRVLADGRIGKFGWRSQFATLEEFVAAACANELGLGTDRVPQPKPIAKPDYPASKPDLDRAQFTALVAFVDTLPRPIEQPPASDSERQAVKRGKEVFHGVGCAICHVPDLGGVTGIYSDLLLHDIEDAGGSGGGDGYGGTPLPPPAPLPDGHPKPSEWRTPPLWGVADSAPYFHDGGSATLHDAILRHRGDAASVTRAYRKLTPADQKALLAFLNTLKAPPDAVAARVATR